MTTLTPEHRVKLRKLATLANFLDDLPHRQFYLGKWTGKDASAHSCGTAACAAGWAAMIFQREGWEFRKSNLNYPGESVSFVPWFNSRAGDNAFADFFGIRNVEAGAVCYNTGGDSFVPYFEEYPEGPYGTLATSVADRIRKILDRYDPALRNITDLPPVSDVIAKIKEAKALAGCAQTD